MLSIERNGVLIEVASNADTLFFVSIKKHWADRGYGVIEWLSRIDTVMGNLFVGYVVLA